MITFPNLDKGRSFFSYPSETMFFWAKEINEDRIDMKSDDRIAHNRFSFGIYRCYPNEQLTEERHSSACHRHII